MIPPSMSMMDESDTENVFSGTVTLDPSETLRAWDTLSRDTWAHDVANLPRVMRAALVHALKEKAGGEGG